MQPSLGGQIVQASSVPFIKRGLSRASEVESPALFHVGAGLFAGVAWARAGFAGNATLSLFAALAFDAADL